MKNKLLPILLLAVSCLFQPALSQINKEVMREFDADDYLSNTLPLGEKGLVMYGFKDKRNFALKLLDKDLDDKLQWSVELPSRSAYAYGIVHHKKDNVLAILFYISKGNYQLTTIDLDNEQVETTEITIPSKIKLTGGTQLVKKSIWVLGTRKSKNYIIKIPLSKPKAVVTELSFGKARKKPYCYRIQVLSGNEIAVLYTYGHRKRRESDAMLLDSKVKTVQESLLVDLTMEQRIQILSMDITRVKKGRYAVAGTFHKHRKAAAEGLYYAKVQDGKALYFKSYGYHEFENFLNYLGAKGKSKKEAKMERRKKRGKDVSISYYSVMHPAIKVDGGMIFITEHYYPTYRSETYTTYVNGKPVTQTRQVFDGYYYTHAMAVGVSDKGEKLYDIYIPLHTYYKPFSVVTFLRISSENDIITLLQVSGSAMYSTTIVEGEIVEKTHDITHSIPKTQKESWTSSSAVWWYGRTFLILERQTVKEKGLLGKRSTHYYALRVEVPQEE